MDCEDCRHLTVVGLHDTGPRSVKKLQTGERHRHLCQERFPLVHRFLGLVVKAPDSIAAYLCTVPACWLVGCLTSYRLVGLVVRRPPRERKIPGSNPAFAGIFFRGRVIPVTLTLALQWLPCQGPGGIGSALGLVGPVSVYCDWVRKKV